MKGIQRWSLFSWPRSHEAVTASGPAPEEPWRGLVGPIATVFGIEEQPTVAVEMAFYPAGGVPELLTDESWAYFLEELGLAPISGFPPLQGVPDGQWQVEVGPHTFISNPSRRFQLILPHPDAAWEEALQASRSCVVVLGTGIGVDDETETVGIPATAAVLTAAHAGSWAVPELADISGLHVVPINSFRPYDPMRPVTFVLDTSVLIAMERLCFEPETLGAKAEDVRHLVVNLHGRDVLPGPALSQIFQPTRTSTQPHKALKALAAFDLLMARSRAEIMDERRPPAVFDPSNARDFTGMAHLPQMLWMYAGTLRLRKLWSPSQTLPERAQSFEAFMRWLRDDLRLNAALLMQVAFNLWISHNAAHHQASRLLRFRAGPVTDATLGELWGTAYDIFLIGGQLDVMQVPDVVDVAILTFDRGLAGMRDFFEHVGTADVHSGADGDLGFAWNSRVKLDLHPGLAHMRERVVALAAELHGDMFARLVAKDTSAFDKDRLLALVEREERLAKCDDARYA